MNETLEYLQTFARFPFALRHFLKQRLTLDEAKQIVRERMEHPDFSPRLHLPWRAVPGKSGASRRRLG